MRSLQLGGTVCFDFFNRRWEFGTRYVKRRCAV